MSFYDRLSFGLVGVSSAEPVTLPLKRVCVNFRVNCGAAYVEMEQLFHQTHKEALDCDYTFPLPEGALVHRCEFQIGKRVVRAKALETGEAHKLQQGKAAAGHRTALVDYVRENLFTLSLSNVQPGDLVVVRMAYCENLRPQGQGLRLRIPLSPGQRYVPAGGEVPDAGRLNPPRIDSLDPRGALLSIRGRLDPLETDHGSLFSPTHPMIARLGEGHIEVVLSDTAAVPEGDFVVEWKQAAKPCSATWVWRRGGESYALARLCAPEGVPSAESAPCDFYFLVDRSGSMSGAKWVKSCEAVRNLVARLRMQDRAWISLFESDFIDVTKQPVPVGELVRREAFRRFEELGTAGGTELIPAAEHAFEVMRAHSGQTRKVLVLITDGQVGNEEQVLGCFGKAGLALEVFTFGIDDAVNDALLEELARRHQGLCALLTPQDDIAAAVGELAGRLDSPVLTDAELLGGWQRAGTERLCFYAGQSMVLNLHSNGRPEQLGLKGLTRAGEVLQVELPFETVHNPAIGLLWCKASMQALQRQNRREEVIALAVSHNLLTRYTSYVAWDEAEQVPVALKSILQPSSVRLRDCVACAGGACQTFTGDEDGYPPSAEHGRVLEEIRCGVAALGLIEPVRSLVVSLCEAYAVKASAFPPELGVLLSSLGARSNDLLACLELCREFVMAHIEAEYTRRSLLEQLKPVGLQVLFELGL